MDTNTFQASDASLVDFETRLAMGVFENMASDLEQPSGINYSDSACVESIGFYDFAGQDPSGTGCFGFELLFLFFRFGVLSFSIEESGAWENKCFAVAGVPVEVGLFFSGGIGGESGCEAVVNGTVFDSAVFAQVKFFFGSFVARRLVFDFLGSFEIR